MESNSAHAGRGPKHSVRKGKISVLSTDEMRELLAGIDTTSLLELRDRALSALIGYNFASVDAARVMKSKACACRSTTEGYEKRLAIQRLFSSSLSSNQIAATGLQGDATDSKVSIHAPRVGGRRGFY